jgi:Ni,Fe-hydrogenase III small subunit
MSKWVLKGLRTGIKTTHYPKREETASGVSPGRPNGGKVTHGDQIVSLCTTGALAKDGDIVSVDYTRCIHCFRCLRTANPLDWQRGYECAATVSVDESGQRKLKKAFHRSLHIRIVDAGACGACLSEISQIGKPYYNIHRLGFFITPTPRDADILFVAGPVTDHMRLPLMKTYEAMPAPKLVLAIGTCALSGGIFGPSFASCGGVSEVLSVDIAVPGCPPPPLAIIHGLLLAVEQKPSALLISPEFDAERARL